MEEHITRILKMLEEGKISAADAQSLIGALRTEAPKPPPHAPHPPPPPPRSDGPEAPKSPEEPGTAKSFEFQWSQRKGFPFDLSDMGRQISDTVTRAVKRIDPERIVREARGIARGGRRWNAGFRGFGWFSGDEGGQPENTMGYPTARASDTLTFDMGPGSVIQVDNNWGPIAVFGGTEKVSLEYEKEAWAPTEAEAEVRLNELNVEAGAHAADAGGSGGQRLEVRVTAPEAWSDGTVSLKLNVPEGVSLRLASIFGDVRVENVSGSVEAHTISGSVTLEHLRGEVRVETISGELTADEIGGPATLTTKSGDVHAQRLARGGAVTGVSGDVHVSGVEGGRIEAKSVSGDVTVEDAGLQTPIDIRLESISGDVRLDRARGNISFKTVSGDAAAAKLEALTLQGETVSGDLRAELNAPFAGTLTTNSVSGDVRIDVPESSHFRFTISTHSGDLACEHAVRDGNRADTLWTGTVGTGAGTVNIQTRSGDVTLGKSEG